MNVLLLRRYISLYKEQFSRVHEMEIYKWEAVGNFQRNFNLDIDNFHVMLEASLARTENLLESGNYWARRMLLRNAERCPQQVRSALGHLLDETTDLRERVIAFRERMTALTHEHFHGLGVFQDDRAAIAYLTLRYPDRYYFYKFEMFREFCRRIQYPYSPKVGDFGNVTQFLSLCALVREELIADNELLELHAGRLRDDHYPDPEHHILTQDFIYAVTIHLTIDESGTVADQGLERESVLCLTPQLKDISFKAGFCDYVARQREQTRLGDLGELFVLQLELAKVTAPMRKRVEHHSKTQGDGLGYDIASVDAQGRTRYIEVKTTAGGADTPFFVSDVELHRSKVCSGQFELHRVYEFDLESGCGKFFVIRGDLSGYCINPVQYDVRGAITS